MSAGEMNSLHGIQRWFQTVITNPDGADGGVRAGAENATLDVQVPDAQAVIRPSARLSAIERVTIYANAYHARLLECLGGCFPVLKKSLGDELFDSFAFEYLQKYPSRSYTLDRLGEHFCAFLVETRPDEGDGSRDPGWPDFLIELATLEWTIGRVFDGPGTEGRPLLTPEFLQSFPADRFSEARLTLVDGFRLHSFHYPVSAYYTAVRNAEEKDIVPIPESGAERVAVFRREYVVRRYALTESQFVLLTEVQAGSTVGEAIAAAAGSVDSSDDSFAAALQSWFSAWSSLGFFAALSL